MMNPNIVKVGLWTIIGFSLSVFNAQAQTETQETKIVVRAQSRDAKFIGTSMGGAFVTIRETKTGEILAKGFTEGSTGDTQKLVTASHERYESKSTPGSAKFETTLNLADPVMVTVSVVAPFAKKQARVETSTRLWLIPGKDIAGDGIILEVPGFVVDVLSPQTHQTLKSRGITVKANIVMMCGCPTSPNGLWDRSEYVIEALIKKDGAVIDSVPLAFTGQTSTYEAVFSAPEPGVYEITVYAYHEQTGNTGVDKTTVIVSN